MSVCIQDKRKHESGFSLIEMLVVMAIMGILSGVVIGLNRSSEKAIALSTEQQRVISILERARSLALQRYTVGSSAYTCAIEVQLSGNTISLNARTRGLKTKVTDCNPITKTNTTSIERYTLEKGVTIDNVKTTINTVYFSSPFLEMTFFKEAQQIPNGPFLIVLNAPGISRDAKIEITSSGAIVPKIQ